MKTVFRIALFTIAFTGLSSCSITKVQAQSNPDTSAFVGQWVGEHRTDELLTTWVQKRFANGTYTILFIQIKGNQVVRNIESGKWWLDNGKFYEISERAMEQPDIYDYKLVSDQLIHFSSTSEDYQFFDKKIKENYFDVVFLK